MNQQEQRHQELVAQHGPVVRVQGKQVPRGGITGGFVASTYIYADGTAIDVYSLQVVSA